MTVVHLDGKLMPLEAARISPLDRGFLLGDGVFETLRAYGGRAFGLANHLARLERSCQLARLPYPADLETAVADVLAANALRDAAVRITITRGPGGRGASPRGAGPSTVLITAFPVPVPPEMYERGVRLVTATRRRVPTTSLDAGIKSLNYLVHVLARAEAEAAGADDALFVDDEGNVVEATQANVFAIIGKTLVTPPLEVGCLPGITRTLILHLGREVGLDAQERILTVQELARADEAFLTASITEVAPIVMLDGAPIGSGRPGELAQRLHALYRKRAAGQF